MNISSNSQLGLRLKMQEAYRLLETKTNFSEYCKIFEKLNTTKIANNELELANTHKLIGGYNQETFDKLKNDRDYLISYRSPNMWIKNIIPFINLVSDTENLSKFYAIANTVSDVIKGIKIGENFNISIFDKFPIGVYTYLLGKDKFLKFSVTDGYIFGFVLSENSETFLFIIDMVENQLICEPKNKPDLNEVLQLLIFVELGEIEIVELLPGRNNNAKKRSDKITNTSRQNITVIDSKWNTVSIRTEGFSVSGHLRLQNYKDSKKLIWINSFQKEGYTRNRNKMKDEKTT